MVIEWILIMVLGGATPMSVEFESKKACETAKIELTKQTSYLHTTVVISCFKKYIREKK